MMNIDRYSLLPLYHQVEEIIRRDIANGRYQPDQPIPTEIALQKKFNVSRETVRRAVNNLVLAGLVEKRKGVGTFVTRPAIAQRLGKLYSSTEDILVRSTRMDKNFDD